MAKSRGFSHVSKIKRKADIFVRAPSEGASQPAEKLPLKIEVFEYWADGFTEKRLASLSELDLSKKRPESIVWVNLDGSIGYELAEEIRLKFGLHPIIVDDIVNPVQRPKSEEFDEYIYIVMKMFSLSGTDNPETVSEQVGIVLQNNLVLSIQEKPGDVFDWVRDRIRTGKGKTRKSGADYLVYRLLDAVVENYFQVLEKIGERIEDLEEQLVNNPTPELLTKVYKMKREVLFMRKSVWPLREAIRKVETDESPFISDYSRIYLREVYDHTIQVIDTVETFLEMLSEMLDTYLSSISNKTNEVMKVLTIIATIFMPLTFVVGVYGMNFHYMPEIPWKWGYPTVLGVMALISSGMVVYFRRKGWL